jgi:hypothetical protein
MEQLPETLSSPNTEVYVNGQKISDPAHTFDGVMEEITGLAALGQLYKIRKNLEDRTSAGLIETWEETITNNIVRYELTRPAQSLGVINDGPDPVLIWINTSASNPKTVMVNEPFNVNFENHALARFYLQCAPGNTAAIRAIAKN